MHMPSVLALDVDTHWREGRVHAGRTRRLIWVLGCYQWQVLLKAVADRRHFPIVEVHFLLRLHYGQQPSDASNRAPTKRERASTSFRIQQTKRRRNENSPPLLPLSPVEPAHFTRFVCTVQSDKGTPVRASTFASARAP